jgi:SnoaL-like polyketide cyclase
MSAENEAVVRRFYEDMNNGRKNELAGELFTADHQMHDPQVPAGDGPDGVAAVVSTYQTAVNGHWEINDIFSSGNNVVVRWTGTGEHVAELNGIPPTSCCTASGPARTSAGETVDGARFRPSTPASRRCSRSSAAWSMLSTSLARTCTRPSTEPGMQKTHLQWAVVPTRC